MTMAHFMLGQYDKGCLAGEKAVEFSLDAHTLPPLILNEIGARRLENARRHAAQLMSVRSDFRASFAPHLFPGRSEEFASRMIEVLREAGIPE